MSETNHNYCLVVPHYEQYKSLRDFLPKLMGLGLPCILVDDGSSEETKKSLRMQINSFAENSINECHLVEHEENRGKGAAIFTGSRMASDLGFSHIIQIDADGQHDIRDVSLFIQESKHYPNQIISGAPTFDDTAPKARLYGRKVTDFWVALETVSLSIRDSLCGFRVYPLAQFQQVYNKFSIGPRMDFDTDLMVKSVWLGIQVRFIETKVIYTGTNESHFHYIRDNVRLVWLHTRLMFGMLFRLPKLLQLRLTGHTASTN